MNRNRIIAVWIALSAALSLSGCSGSRQIEDTPIKERQFEEKSKEVLQTEDNMQEKEEEIGKQTISEHIENVDLESYFDGINGCAVFYSAKKNEYYIYNEKLSEKRSSPCSTFKIISSLTGLESGGINPSDSMLKWNGTAYWKEEWNKDIDFSEAFKTSCVWYFREVINQIGKERMLNSLTQLNYGNSDISDWEGRLNTNNNNRDLTGFWIESSLEISPLEQVKVLADIFETGSAYKEDTIQLLKEVMLFESNEDMKIYGKTGMGVKDGKCVDAWYVGMLEIEDEYTYFAVRLDDPEKKEVSSQKAREILLNTVKK